MGHITYPISLPGEVRMARPTACTTSMGLLLASRKATALREGESVPSPKMPTLMTPWGFPTVPSASLALALFLPLRNVAARVYVVEGVGCWRFAGVHFSHPVA